MWLHFGISRCVELIVDTVALARLLSRPLPPQYPATSGNILPAPPTLALASGDMTTNGDGQGVEGPR